MSHLDYADIPTDEQADFAEPAVIVPRAAGDLYAELVKRPFHVGTEPLVMPSATTSPRTLVRIRVGAVSVDAFLASISSSRPFR